MRKATVTVAERLEPTKQLTSSFPLSCQGQLGWVSARTWTLTLPWGRSVSSARCRPGHQVCSARDCPAQVRLRPADWGCSPWAPAPCTAALAWPASPRPAWLCQSRSAHCPACCPPHSWGGEWHRAQWGAQCSQRPPCCPAVCWGRPAWGSQSLSVRTGSGLTSSADPELRNCLWRARQNLSGLILQNWGRSKVLGEEVFSNRSSRSLAETCLSPWLFLIVTSNGSMKLKSDYYCNECSLCTYIRLWRLSSVKTTSSYHDSLYELT